MIDILKIILLILIPAIIMCAGTYLKYKYGKKLKNKFKKIKNTEN